MSSPLKKKNFFLAKETQALLKATEAFRKEGNFEPDAVWDCIKNSKTCQELKLTEIYTKIQKGNYMTK